MKIAKITMHYPFIGGISKHMKWMDDNEFDFIKLWQDIYIKGVFVEYENRSTSHDSILCLNPECKSSFETNKSEAKTTPQNTYIDAVHFGNKKPYTWRVPEHLKCKVEPGKIAKVKTKHGDQFVEIVKVYKKEVEPSVHRGVMDVLDD